MPFSPALFDALIVASANSMPAVLTAFASFAPATLHLASRGPDLLWHLRHSTPDLLILEQGLLTSGSALPADGLPPPIIPPTLYLGQDTNLAVLPSWLTTRAATLPWPAPPERIQHWIQQSMPKREEAAPPSASLQLGTLRLDLHRSRVGIGPHEHPLTATEARLLAMLMHRVGQLISREALGAACLDTSTDPKKRRLDTHISNLRRKLQASNPNTDSGPCIHSYRGRGYMLTVESASAGSLKSA